MDNRSQILGVALQLFSDRGYDAVGVQEIAEAAGVTKPTLYHYFGSKQGLLKTLLEGSFEPFNRAVSQAAGYSGDLPLTLENLVRAYFDFARQHPVDYRLQLALYFAPRSSEAWHLVAGLNSQQYQVVENLFRSASKEHGNMTGRHQLYAASFIGQVNTCISLWLNGYLELEDSLVHRVVHQFQHGIYS